jgi:N6-adenosine-specific RNA methylase IME4
MRPREQDNGVKRYRTIVADPPWQISKRMRAGGRRARSTEVPYEFMTVDEWVADEAHLYLWSTRKLFREGIAADVARAWGFEPVSEIIWGLRNPGMGGFNGSGHEPVLLASRGDLPWPKAKLPQGVEFWRQTYLHGKVHSAKPEALLDHVAEWSPEPRLELFARRARFGWDYWGNESLGTAEMTA